MRNVFTILLRFLILWVVNAVCFSVSDRILPGLSILMDKQIPAMVSVMSVSLVFTLLNLLVRPFLMLLTLPLTGGTIGLFSLIINALILFLVSWVTDFFVIDTLGTGLLAGFLFSLTNIVLSILIPIDDDLLYYDFLGDGIRRQTRLPDDGEKGIIVLEIDGLSHDRLLKAVSRRQMPFMKDLLDSGKFVISEFDCGIPSQTSSAQAGIMFGNNYDICAYRWYDKKQRKVISSGSFQDAGWMEKRILDGGKSGLLENGGSSINNLISGNASVAILTVSAIIPKDNTERLKRTLDMYLFSLKPYLLNKSIIFTIAEMGIEVLQYAWAWIRDKKPRLNRLRRFYPLVRGVSSVLLRDISTSLIINDVYRGRPAIYATFYGHDEIAHHSGPDSWEAMHALVGIDRAIKKIVHAAEKESGRDYALFVLSDHGQSFGATFKQRYGYSLSEFVRQLAYECAVEKAYALVTGIWNSADNDANIRAALVSLQIAKWQRKNRLQQQALAGIERALDKNESKAIIDRLEARESDIWVLASGNLVNIYFAFISGKAQRQDIERNYPDFCRQFVEHPGVGLILLQDAGEPVAIGKNGSRNLISGIIQGEDPLKTYGNADKRASQLRYLSEFPSGGDIIVFSTLYPDGTVASFEELIGSHGGMGGPQTAPFIFHPAFVNVPSDIHNASEIYDVLQRTRHIPAENPRPQDERARTEKNCIGSWRPRDLIRGIHDTKKWTPLLRDVLLFHPAAYRKIGNDPTLNGPALLIALISLAANLTVWGFLQPFASYGLIIGFIAWIINWSILTGAAYSSTLMLRSNGSGPQFTRGLMFCSIFDLLSFGLLVPGQSLFWAALLLSIRLVSVSTAIAGISEIESRKKILIIPSILCVMGIIILSIFAITDSVAYLFNVEQLKDLTDLIRINLSQ